MSAKWMERKKNNSRGGKHRSRSSSRTKDTRSQKVERVEKKVEDPNRLKRITDDLEPIPTFEPVEVSLDNDPENQDARIEQMFKEIDEIERDINPNSTEEREKAREIMAE